MCVCVCLCVWHIRVKEIWIIQTWMRTFVCFAFTRGKVPLCVNEGISFLLRNEKLTKLREPLLLFEFLILQKRIRLHCRKLLRCKFFHFNQFRAASRASKYIAFFWIVAYILQRIYPPTQRKFDSNRVLCARESVLMVIRSNRQLFLSETLFSHMLHTWRHFCRFLLTLKNVILFFFSKCVLTFLYANTFIHNIYVKKIQENYSQFE